MTPGTKSKVNGGPTFAPPTITPAMISPTTVRVLIEFLAQGRVRIKIRIRVRVRVRVGVMLLAFTTQAIVAGANVVHSRKHIKLSKEG